MDPFFLPPNTYEPAEIVKGAAIHRVPPEFAAVVADPHDNMMGAIREGLSNACRYIQSNSPMFASVVTKDKERYILNMFHNGKGFESKQEMMELGLTLHLTSGEGNSLNGMGLPRSALAICENSPWLGIMSRTQTDGLQFVIAVRTDDGQWVPHADGPVQEAFKEYMYRFLGPQIEKKSGGAYMASVAYVMPITGGQKLSANRYVKLHMAMLHPMYHMVPPNMRVYVWDRHNFIDMDAGQTLDTAIAAIGGGGGQRSFTNSATKVALHIEQRERFVEKIFTGTAKGWVRVGPVAWLVEIESTHMSWPGLLNGDRLLNIRPVTPPAGYQGEFSGTIGSSANTSRMPSDRVFLVSSYPYLYYLKHNPQIANNWQRFADNPIATYQRHHEFYSDTLGLCYVKDQIHTDEWKGPIADVKELSKAALEKKFKHHHNYKQKPAITTIINIKNIEKIRTFEDSTSDNVIEERGYNPDMFRRPTVGFDIGSTFQGDSAFAANFVTAAVLLLRSAVPTALRTWCNQTWKRETNGTFPLITETRNRTQRIPKKQSFDIFRLTSKGVKEGPSGWHFSSVGIVALRDRDTGEWMQPTQATEHHDGRGQEVQKKNFAKAVPQTLAKAYKTLCSEYDHPNIPLIGIAISQPQFSEDGSKWKDIPKKEINWGVRYRPSRNVVISVNGKRVNLGKVSGVPTAPPRGTGGPAKVVKSTSRVVPHWFDEDNLNYWFSFDEINNWVKINRNVPELRHIFMKEDSDFSTQDFKRFGRMLKELHETLCITATAFWKLPTAYDGCPIGEEYRNGDGEYTPSDRKAQSLDRLLKSVWSSPIFKAVREKIEELIASQTATPVAE